MPVIPGSRSRDAAVIPWQRWDEGGGMSFNRETLHGRDHVVLADNLDLLRYMSDGCVDLVYIDPPFATGKLRESPRGSDGPSYNDAWDSIGDFVDWLAPRLREMWRVLADDGSIVIHLDTHAVHHVRIWCDEEYGAGHFENEIIWHYTGGGRSKKRFSRKHDVLLWYSKGPGRVFNIDAVREPYEPTSGYAKGGIVSKKGRKYMPHPDGKPADDVWNIPIVNPLAGERTDYPTQKPLKLLDRVIRALSCEGALVADFFMGSGTTAVAAREAGRRFICCDDNVDSLEVTLGRIVGAGDGEDSPAVVSHGKYSELTGKK